MVTDADERRMFSADLPREWLSTPPGNAPIELVYDVLLVTGDPGVDTSGIATHPPVLMPTYPHGPAGPAVDPATIDLGFGIEMTRLERTETERILNACSVRGHYFHPVRQFGQRYTSRREVAREQWENHLYGWDPDEVLTDLLAMSRLIIDHGYSTEFAARVIERQDGEQSVMPVPGGQPVYRLSQTRDWMTAVEVDQLRALFGSFRARRDGLPGRVKRALWNLDYGATVRWLDIRLPLLVIAFERLINTSTALVRRQFGERVPQLAEDLGLEGIDTSFCKRMYDARSRWAHGSHVRLARETRTDPEPDQPLREAAAAEVESVALLEQALRQVVRRCIEEEEFAAHFEGAESVRAQWPVQV
jgi:hypothetical protein